MPRNEHKKVMQQLSEAYQNVYKESREISSEELDKGTPNAHGAMITPRAIFVGANSLPHFQEVVRQKGLDKLNIQFLQSVEKPELGVIVIPYSKEAVNMDIDKILIDENPPENEGGFWGQKGVGYAGKHWVSIDDTQSIDEYNPGYGKVPPIEDAEDTDWDAWNRAEMKQDYESRQEDVFKPGDIVEAGPFRDGEPDHLEVVLTIDGDVVNTIPIADDAYGNKYGGRGGLDIELIRPLGDGEPDSREQFNPMEFPSDES